MRRNLKGSSTSFLLPQCTFPPPNPCLQQCYWIQPEQPLLCNSSSIPILPKKGALAECKVLVITVSMAGGKRKELKVTRFSSRTTISWLCHLRQVSFIHTFVCLFTYSPNIVEFFQSSLST